MTDPVTQQIADQSKLQRETPIFGPFETPSGAVSLTVLTNSLLGVVSLYIEGTWFDGPTIDAGSTGTWFISGQVWLGTSAATISVVEVRLWDGSTVIAT